MEKSLTVLFVEDDKLSQTVGKLSFREIGIPVDIASSGKDALLLASQKVYDLIVMDIGLGDMDGFEVAQTIRQNSGKNKKTPIIALTAHADTESQNQSKEVGMNQYLVKPLTMEKVHGIINDFFPQFSLSKN